jgi:hypothetical protein
MERSAVVQLSDVSARLTNRLVAYPMAAEFLRRHLMEETLG